MNDDQRRLSRRYIVYQALTNLWFISAIWLYFYRLFITDQQVGVLDGLAFAIGLLAEVPSGALADKFGRDKMARAGQLLIATGLLTQAVGSDFVPFFVGQAVMMIGVSFVSGADEALFFERLRFDRKSAEWRKLITRGSQAALVATLVATVLGGWLYTVNPRLPWAFNGVAFLLAAIAIWPVMDSRPKQARQKPSQELRGYLHDIRTGFAQFGTAQLRLYVPLILTVQGLFYTADYGLLRLVLLGRFHFDPFWSSVAIASSGLITVGLLAYMHKHADNLSEKRVLAVIGLGAAAALLLSLANIGSWGYIVILTLYAGGHVLQPFLSEVLNYHASDQQRATVLSVASFLRTLPYVILAPIIGYLNTHGKLHYFLVVWAALITGSVMYYLRLKKRDAHIALPSEGN